MKEDLIALGRPKKNAVQTSNIGMAASIDRDFAMLERSAGCFISCLRGSLLLGFLYGSRKFLSPKRDMLTSSREIIKRKEVYCLLRLCFMSVCLAMFLCDLIIIWGVFWMGILDAGWDGWSGHHFGLFGSRLIKFYEAAKKRRNIHTSLRRHVVRRQLIV
jgi:hypothetical protein